ncbi:hypothetical protein ACFO0N_20350 [Halobium salinum]|uniref:Uncharacterized protein n=1 Tax=Halobium salinum TaxID=1364940 RepID=A0ABD5PIF0_9EURY|nr:hypothetical protein [Halobium salinum]
MTGSDALAEAEALIHVAAANTCYKRLLQMNDSNVRRSDNYLRDGIGNVSVSPAQVPSPEFCKSGPTPFSVAPLPIPPGHPESDQPLTGDEEVRVEAAIERVKERTNAEFGIADSVPEPRDSPEDVQVRLGTDNGNLDQALAKVIRTIQLRNGVREENGDVPVEEVDDELRSLFADVDADPPSYEELGAVRERSQLLAVDLDTDTGELAISLTERGEEVVTPDTGDVQAAGGSDHDDGVYEIERALTAAGFDARVLTQDRSEQPDGRATHPELDVEFAIEVETTTPENPVKVLTNLRKAQDEETIPLFVVRPEKTETFWAERVDRILRPPVKERAGENETPHLYTFDEPLKARRASTGERLSAVRPVTGPDDSRRTVWRVEDDQIVLLDGDGTEYTRVSQDESISEHAVPGVYTYDETMGEYVVTTGDARQTYDSKAAFEAEWVTVKKPFVPEVELPVPAFTHDTYRILILPEGGDPVVYGGDGTTQPLSTLITDSPRIAGKDCTGQCGESIEESETSEESADEIENTDTVEPSFSDETVPDIETLDDGEWNLERFVQTYVEEDPDAIVPKNDLYQAYVICAEHHDEPTETKVWFSRNLRGLLDIETSRRRVDGSRVRCYVGADLTEAGWELLD